MNRSILILAVFAVLFSLLNVAALTDMADKLEAAETRIAQLEEDLYDDPAYVCSTDTECEEEEAVRLEAAR